MPQGDDERAEGRQIDSEHKWHPKILADIAGLDEDVAADYVHYRKLELELCRFLWEHPDVLSMVMAVNQNIAAFQFPGVPPRKK